MRKFRILFCAFICLLISATSVSAAGNMNIEWRGDYSDNENPKLTITFTSPVQYIQQVGVIIYPAGTSEPSVADYVDMKEIKVNGGVETTTYFRLTDVFDAANGAYTVELNGSGYRMDESADSADVYVIKKGDVQGLLEEFRNASSSTFSGVLDKVILPLQLTDEMDGTRKSARISAMLNMRTDDFNGAFATLDDVRDAWRISDILVYIGESSATAEGVKEKIITNADLLNINISDIDFTTHIDELSQDLLEYNRVYKSGAGIGSLKDLKDAIGECLGVIVINNSTEDNMKNNFEKYKSYFDITSSTLTAYENLSPNYQGKALRDLYMKNFATPSALISAFDIAVKDVNSGNTGDSPVVNIPTQNNPGQSGANSVPGGVSAPTTPQPAENTGFSDMTSSHWAYHYVKELVEKGIISGYDDNTFKPNNNVTREEFIKMIVGASGLYKPDAECSFSDVSPDAWYYRYVASAYTNEVVNGIDDRTFGVGNKITRQDVAVIAARILTRFNSDVSGSGEVTLTDFDTISDYAQDSVKLLNGMGIINGFDDGTFMPYNALTRAEAATIIHKLISNF